MAKIVAEIKGLKQLVKELKRLKGQAPTILSGALFRFAEDKISGPAKDDYVPVRFGALRSSIITRMGDVSRGRVEVIVGAGGSAAPYALAVHENPRAGKTGGISPQGKKYKVYSRVGQWKYLETPALLAAQNSASLIADVRQKMESMLNGPR